MMQCRHVAIAATLLLSGCIYHARERVDQSLCALTFHPYDQQPPTPAANPSATPAAVPAAPAKPTPNDGACAPPLPPMDVQTVAWLQSGQSLNQPPGTDQRLIEEKRLDLNIPPEIPGSDARRLELPKEPAARQREIERLFPELPPLPAAPITVPGPAGQPYTLADLQQMAATNSPQLRQAAADVEAARGNMIQANAYPNPTVSYQMQPSNNGSTPGADGFGMDQTIKTGGKLRLQASAAEMDVYNAELALRRARSDLATQVRSAYFAVLVAKETVRVNKALAHFTEEVYRLQADLLAGGFAAPYEPAALRAQAYSARLAYKQAIQTYIYCWKQLVAAINVRQLPLSEVAGRVDSAIPYYDFDAILAYVLRNHTDLLTACNGIDKARYNLKLAQVTPVPDVDVNVAVLRDFSLAPKQVTPTLTLGVPIPVWDHNKGAIVAAESALVRAEEEPHRAEQNLTNALAAAYMNYKNSLDSLEYYRRYILPDQVRAYRGAYDRRQIDPNASFGDVVSAQQTLASNVTTYLQTLGQVWNSVTNVADLIQTDDLFEFARPEAVPPLFDLEQLTPLPCCHPCTTPPDARASLSVGTDSSVPVVEPLPVPEPLPRPVFSGSIAPAGSQGG
jgi:outer membrane protein, heavy metal efflux system